MATKSSPRKRSFRQFDEISAIDKPSDVGEKATVHGVITSLSPKIKEGNMCRTLVGESVSLDSAILKGRSFRQKRKQ